MSTFAESATQFANSWPAVALAVVSIVGGWGTVIIKFFIEARKNNATGQTVNEIKEQVADGGDYDTNLREDVAEGLQLMKFAVSHIENLPTTDDIKRLDGRIDALGRRVSAIEKQDGQ
ncbi:hypothetical protein EUA02_25690 [Mycobacterium paragordonae]|uniref:hypothetical protein n=1 Tax=Mycobacterium paragordonae TaxID=1389713 RepID=UPI00105DE743|nr:hypothetical protein [Mycobacterium paragordonae]TDK88802.1 hypothetical protein EUA02_25690 [Mycobacterium paragordonae]TDK95984.1 hypothetical protein EUA05_32555 [Mycobacterium paragordonae]